MNRRRRVVLVCVAGLIAGLVAHLLAPESAAGALCLLAAGIVLGELLVLRLEDGSAIPLSFAVLIVLASAFSLPEYAAAVLGAEAIALFFHFSDATEPRRDAPLAGLGLARVVVLGERLVVAAATFAAYRGMAAAVQDRETITTVLLSLGAAAAAQVLVDVPLRHLLGLGASFSARGRLAWLAIASSGILMAVGYRGVNGDGDVGLWGPLLFSTPLLAAWYAFERLDSATRSFRQTIEALAMAPELGGIVPAGHAQRVAVLAAAMGDRLGLSPADVQDLEMAALLHHLGQVTLDDPEHDVNPREVAAVTGAMMQDIRPLSVAGDIVSGDVDDPKRRLAAQVLRIASEYDDLTARDNTPGELALESLRSAPAYVYDERVFVALERVVNERLV
jgi:hypothetical protein